MVKANINSKNNVFLTKEGLVFNSEFTLVKPPIYKKYNISVINYRDKETNKAKQIPLTRLMYLTFYPERNISKATVTRKSQEIDNMYCLDNLLCVPNTKMVSHNKLERFKNNLKQEQKSFYEHLTLLQQNTFKEMLTTSKFTVKFLAVKYGVSEMAIYRARRKLNFGRIAKI